MAGTKEIKRRINSISNTAQITNALYMVSASKMVKAQQRAEEAFGYSDGLYELVKMLAGLKADDYESLYLKKPEQVKKVVIVIVGPTRGFVGSLKSNLTISLNRQIEEIRSAHPEAEISAIAVNKLGQKIAGSLGLKLEYYFENIEEPASTGSIESLKKLLLEGFEKGKFDEIYLAVMHFKSVLLQEAVVKKLLPIETEEEEIGDSGQKEGEVGSSGFTFEPSAGKILDKLLPEYFENQLFVAVLDSFASEHSARMVSMQSATDNARDLKNSLFLKFNRSRQNKITEELIDIVSGSITN
ncbi:ATP synthase F1 subunit gamma [Candidatus Dojkabacteria bacterium]|nr:ATP synthase F1 subunit gamma [Candidatus Dojkabacteria bacterium]